MRNIQIYLIAILATLALCIGCDRESMTFNDSTSSTDDGAVGYLSVSAMTLTVEENSETFDDGTRAQTKAATSIDTYIVLLVNSDNDTVYNDTYATIMSLEEPLALSPDVYNLVVLSTLNIPVTAWETPHYKGTQEVVIVKNTTTKVDSFTCSLDNIKASVSLAADLNDLFQADADTEHPLQVKLSIDDNSLVYSREETREGYFAAPAETNTLEVVLSGMYNTAAADEAPNYTYISEWKQSLSDVRAGQWRKIYIKVLNASSGSVEFQITVETWTYDDEIVVDVMTANYLLQEEALDDPENEVTDPLAPVVTLDGQDIATPFMITSSLFDFDAETCSTVIKNIITPQEDCTVASLTVEVASDNASLLSMINAAGFDKYRVPLLPTNDVSDYITIRTDATTGVVTLTTKYSGMARIYNYAGTHTVKVIATDNIGRTSYTSYTIEVITDVVEGDGPSVVWQGGYSFSERYDVSLTSYPNVVIDITSATGITSFEVEITSVTLTEEELEGMKLAKTMDLINPATDDMSKALAGLGFPVGSELQGSTYVQVDITQFMPALSVLGAGHTDFKLTVGDAAGVTTKTIQVNAVVE